MIKHADRGLELQLWGFEIPKGYQAGNGDPYYAALVAKVLKIADINDFMLEDIEAPEDFQDKPLKERMTELSSEARQTTFIYDHEVPALLGMSRIVLHSAATYEGLTTLPIGHMKILIESLQDYEDTRLGG